MHISWEFVAKSLFVAVHLFGVDSTKAIKTEFGIEYHASWRLSQSSTLFHNLMGPNFSFTIFHRFSMGFKSEDCAGQV